MRFVKVADMLKHNHGLANETVLGTALHMKDAEFVIKLDDCLKMRGITQKELSLMTGIRLGTVSDMVNGKGASFNKTRLITVLVALRITNLSDLIELRFPNELQEQYDKERTEWINSREMPESIKDMYRDNVLKSQGL